MVNPDVLPPLEEATGRVKGFKYIAAGLRKLTNWRLFCDMYSSASLADKVKLLSHSGHGSVTVLSTNTPHTRKASAQAARVTIRRITRAAALGNRQLDQSTSCPHCDIPAGSPESLERHSVRCPNSGYRQRMHSGLVLALQAILLESGIPKSSILFEAGGLRRDKTRPGDVVVLDFFGLDRHF